MVYVKLQVRGFYCKRGICKNHEAWNCKLAPKVEVLRKPCVQMQQ